MNRKGGNRVRTGCLTCKIRKIKCDESKPNCSRCVDTGRTCDGYYPHVYAALPRRQPQALRTLLSRQGDTRAVEFFFVEVARAFWAPHNSSFWTDHIFQLCSTEEVIRHSIIAVSLVYEESLARGTASAQLRHSNSFLHHFNAAISQLRHTQDRHLVLVGCLLFICIEAIQHNYEQANIHAKHGVSMFRALGAADARIKDRVGPMFDRLSLMPLFFSHETSLSAPRHRPAVTPQVGSLRHAGSLLEVLGIRSGRLFRCGEAYRHGALRGKPVPAALLASQQEIQGLIARTQALIAQFEQQTTPCRYKDAWYFSFVIRAEVCRIRTLQAFEPDEVSYDKFLETFRAIVRLAQHPGCAMRMLADTVPETELRSELGYLQLVYFIATKCRDLATRLAALELLRRYSHSPDRGCNGLNRQYTYSRRIIEVEHNLILNTCDQPIGHVEWAALPAGATRVLSAFADPYDVIRARIKGRSLAGKPEGFIMRSSHNEMYHRIEFINARLTDDNGKEEFTRLEKSLMRRFSPLHEPVTTNICPV